MNATTAVTTTPADLSFLEKHEQDRQRRRAEQIAKRPLLRDCMNPHIAAWHESQKPLFTWEVEVGLFRPGDNAHVEQFHESVIAGSENDAWAVFCDKIGEWPSRRESDVKITQGPQLSPEAAAAHRHSAASGVWTAPSATSAPSTKKRRGR